MRGSTHFRCWARWRLAFRPATWPARSVVPWASGMPGLEHPAAWGLGTGGRLQACNMPSAGPKAARPFTPNGWAPVGEWATAGRRRGARWTLGWSSCSTARLRVDGRPPPRRRAVRIPRQRLEWRSGLGGWRGPLDLDGRDWSWDAQYGPGGYNPGAPTGEPEGRTLGGSWNPEVTAGVAAERPARRGSSAGPQSRRPLHHALRPIQPHFSPSPPTPRREGCPGGWKVTERWALKRSRGGPGNAAACRALRHGPNSGAASAGPSAAPPATPAMPRVTTCTSACFGDRTASCACR